MQHEKPPATAHKTRTRPRSRFSRAITVSVVFHVVVAAGLLFWYLPIPNGSSTTHPGADPRSPQMASEAPSPREPSRASRAVSEQIQQSIDQQIARSETLDDAQKLDELEQNLSRIERIASEESVEEMTSKIAQSLGLDRDQYGAKTATAPGEIDLDSAQIQDVSRTKNELGEWEYEAILLDSQGRTSSVPMTSSEGAPMFDTFEKIKQYPMAEGMYRQIIMPLIQKLIKAEAPATQE